MSRLTNSRQESTRNRNGGAPLGRCYRNSDIITSEQRHRSLRTEARQPRQAQCRRAHLSSRMQAIRPPYWTPTHGRPLFERYYLLHVLYDCKREQQQVHSRQRSSSHQDGFFEPSTMTIVFWGRTWQTTIRRRDWRKAHLDVAAPDGSPVDRTVMVGCSAADTSGL